MAESKDIEINQFPIVSSLSNKDYVVVSLDDGSQGRIKTSDLASVVAGIKRLDLVFKPRGWLNASDDLNLITDNGFYAVSGKPANSPIDYGMFLSFNADGYKLQIAISSMNDNIVKYRTGWPNFKNWKSLSVL